MAKRRSKRRGSDKTCGIEGCDGSYKRTIASTNVKKAFEEDEFESDSGKVPLCKEHYKEYKKATKEDRELRWMG